MDRIKLIEDLAGIVIDNSRRPTIKTVDAILEHPIIRKALELLDKEEVILDE